MFGRHSRVLGALWFESSEPHTMCAFSSGWVEVPGANLTWKLQGQNPGKADHVDPDLET